MVLELVSRVALLLLHADRVRTPLPTLVRLLHRADHLRGLYTLASQEQVAELCRAGKLRAANFAGVQRRLTDSLHVIVDWEQPLAMNGGSLVELLVK